MTLAPGKRARSDGGEGRERGARVAAAPELVSLLLELRAELVAVSGIYRTFEDGVPAQHTGKPVRISLEADADTLSMRAL